MQRALFEHICQHERHLWPNLCFYLDHYLLTYCCGQGVCPNPMDAYAISSLENRSQGDLLLTFYRLLARAVAVTSVGSFSYWNYLDGPKNLNAWVFAFKDAPVKGKLPDHVLTRPAPRHT